VERHGSDGIFLDFRRLHLACAPSSNSLVLSCKELFAASSSILIYLSNMTRYFLFRPLSLAYSALAVFASMSTIGSVAAVQLKGPITMYCPCDASCTVTKETIGGLTQGCSSSLMSSSNGVCTKEYTLTCESNYLECAAGCSTTKPQGGTGDTSMPDMSMPDMPDFDMTGESSSASGSTAGGNQGNCCKVDFFDSCPSGFTQSGIIMGATPCCYSSGGTIYGGTISSSMPSCNGFTPDVLKGGSESGSSTLPSDSTGTNGLDCDSLLAQVPGCQTCVSKCGDQAAQCGCSPVCFGGGLTSCQAKNTGGGSGSNVFDDLAAELGLGETSDAVSIDSVRIAMSIAIAGAFLFKF